MEHKTFSDPGVARELGRFALVKIDCTSDEDPAVAAVQKNYGADTLPTLVLLDRAGKVARKIDHVVDPDELLPLLRAVR
jgi:thiol:disulfide interchange protein